MSKSLICRAMFPAFVTGNDVPFGKITVHGLGRSYTVSSKLKFPIMWLLAPVSNIHDSLQLSLKAVKAYVLELPDDSSKMKRFARLRLRLLRYLATSCCIRPEICAPVSTVFTVLPLLSLVVVHFSPATDKFA